MAVKIQGKRSPQGMAKGKNKFESTQKVAGPTFVDAVEQVQRAESEMDLNTLLERVKEQSERVKKRVDIQELLEYKKRVQQFLDHAVKHAMKFERDSHLDRYGNHKIYAIVKKIDEDMDLLTRMVLAEERDTLKILNKLDEVQGMLLDIYT